MKLELNLKTESERLRHTSDALTRGNKEFDQLKRTIKKKQELQIPLRAAAGLESQNLTSKPSLPRTSQRGVH